MLPSVSRCAYLRDGAAQVETDCRFPSSLPLFPGRIPLVGCGKPDDVGRDEQTSCTTDTISYKQLLPQPHVGPRVRKPGRSCQRKGHTGGRPRCYRSLFLAVQPAGERGSRVVGLQPQSLSRGVVYRQRPKRSSQRACGQGTISKRPVVCSSQGRHQ